MSKIKLDFVIIGAQKSGTSTIHDILKKHPSIQLPYIKEGYEYLFKSNLLEDCFKTSDKNFKFGMIIPQVMCYPQLLKKVLKNNPNVKLICILRNPLDRMVSSLNMYYQWGYISKKKYLNYNFKIPKNFKYMKIDYTLKQIKFDRSINNIVSWSYYGKTLNYLINKFKIKKTKIFVLKFDDLKKNNLEKLFKFLGIEKIKSDLIIKKNSSNVKIINRFLFYIIEILKKYYFIRFIFNSLPNNYKNIIMQNRRLYIKKKIYKREFKFSKFLVNSLQKDLQKNYLTKTLKFNFKQVD